MSRMAEIVIELTIFTYNIYPIVRWSSVDFSQNQSVFARRDWIVDGKLPIDLKNDNFPLKMTILSVESSINSVPPHNYTRFCSICAIAVSHKLNSHPI